ncbi:DoxX family protein [uncultured Hoeflea sp.]|mgnify:FL=1|uniref:DoxX family protein n=1 Tax=uncultured Hoeflea sp. TaxID=538666 RepID=UPI0030EC0792|tara:strand:- start:28 stop:399 length:372 start_codon:yes stop_codon:yes gene_type:complete
MTYVSLTIRILLTLAFVAAGGAKIIGVDMMVATFDQVGLGQWLRYLTGIIELGGAVLLWLPGLQAIGAMVLGGTMVGAVLTHLFILGPSAVPAIVLGILCAAVLYLHRDQIAALLSRSEPSQA